MANEMAERLGYTNREAASGKHIAMNMSLTNAIRMGLVVNPKLISCAYNLKNDGSLDRLKGKIYQIEDIQKRNEKLEEYEKLRRSIENAEGISEVLQANIKKGGKYIVFLPIVDEIEDEDGNVIGRKTGKDKMQDYERQIVEYFKGSDITPNFHSMLGEYGDKDNERRLEEFQNRNTDDTEFMLVMNKANEGLHLENLDGMIWLRPMDENSRILYLQQLGRVIYSEDPDNPTKDENRPVVIDLVNNTLKVNWENEITEQDDIELLRIIVDWVEKHDGTLPNINSTDKEETGYASVLKEIQAKYKEYLEGDFEDLEEKQIEEIQEILSLGSLIDLWQSELPDRIVKSGQSKGRSFADKNAGPFELTGILKDFVELEDETDRVSEITAVERFIDKIERLYSIGIDVSKLTTTDTIKTLGEKSKTNLDEIEQLGLDLNDKLGNTKSNIAMSYRGKGDLVKPTEEQVKRLLELGINLEIRNVTQELIEELEKLQAIGVDVSKIGAKDTIKTLAKKSKISEEKIKEIGLNPDERIGRRKVKVAACYRGKEKGVKPTEEEVKRLQELGINLEKKERNVTGKLIETLEKLQTIGVDVSRLQFNDTIESLVTRSGINIREVEKVDLKADDKIGNKIGVVTKLYRGQAKGNMPTEEQIKKLQGLGISLDKKEKNATQEFIEKLQKLQTIGVDVSRIKWDDTIQTIAERSKISIDEIKKIGLELDDKIGQTKNNISQAYRNNRRYSKPTKEQLEVLQGLGISLDKKEKNAIQELIEKLQKLQAIGVDVSKIKWDDTIQTIAERSEIDMDEIKKIGLNPEDKIGETKNNISRRYREKQGTTKPSKEEIEVLQGLGISLEKIERNAPQEFIDILENLQGIGVNVSKLTTTDTIETLAKKSGIDVQKINEVGLDPREKIGSKKSTITRVIRGKEKGNKPTEEQVKRLLELGISLETRTRTGREIAEASISSLTDIEMTDREDVALTALVEKTKEGGIKANEQS